MVRLSWSTDVHLNFLSESEVDSFADEINGGAPDYAVITGDISEAPGIRGHLEQLQFVALGVDRAFSASVSLPERA